MFRIKDLLVTILPAEGSGQTDDAAIWGGEQCGRSNTLYLMASIYSWMQDCTDCPRDFAGERPPSNDQLRETLKGQLDEALWDLDQDPDEIDKKLQPKSIEQVDALERRLNAALQELKQRRKDLEQH